MNCLRPLEQWGRVFESRLSDTSLCFFRASVLIATLRSADPPSKELYWLHIRLETWKIRPGPNKGLQQDVRIYFPCGHARNLLVDMCFIKYRVGGGKVKLQAFLNSGLAGGVYPTSRACHKKLEEMSLQGTEPLDTL
jgi:hypothetical protein